VNNTSQGSPTANPWEVIGRIIRIILADFCRILTGRAPATIRSRSLGKNTGREKSQDARLDPASETVEPP